MNKKMSHIPHYLTYKLAMFSMISMLGLSIPLLAQEELEKLKFRFPSSIGEFKTYEEPELVKMKVNGEDYYHLAQTYNVNIDTFFTIRLHDYGKEPEFIDRMLTEFENSLPYEDTLEKWSNLKILGHPTKLQIIKKYLTYNYTTLVKEKSWFITFSWNGVSKEQSEKYMTIVLRALLNE